MRRIAFLISALVALSFSGARAQTYDCSSASVNLTGNQLTVNCTVATPSPFPTAAPTASPTPKPTATPSPTPAPVNLIPDPTFAQGIAGAGFWGWTGDTGVESCPTGKTCVWALSGSTLAAAGTGSQTNYFLSSNVIPVVPGEIVQFGATVADASTANGTAGVQLSDAATGYTTTYAQVHQAAGKSGAIAATLTVPAGVTGVRFAFVTSDAVVPIGKSDTFSAPYVYDVGGTATPSPAPTVSPNGATACVNGSLYTIAKSTNFSTLAWQSSGIWFPQYTWGFTNPGAGDVAYYFPWTSPNSGFSASNGMTNLTARPASVLPQPIPSTSPASTYGSAMIASSNGAGGGYAQRYGYYHVQMQLAGGPGSFPSFWMLDVNGARNEIDVFECPACGVTYTLWQDLVQGNYQGATSSITLAFDPTKGVHDYGVLTTPSDDVYYVDGVPTHHSGFDNTVGPMYFLISNQVGGVGSWPGPPPAGAVLTSSIKLFEAYAPPSVATSC